VGSVSEGSDPDGSGEVAHQVIDGETHDLLPGWATVDWDRLSGPTTVRVVDVEKPAIGQDLLALPSDLFPMPNGAGSTESEASERAARAEEEARVLRRELERERRERERLEALLAERRGPRLRLARSKPTGG
jgi:hypothetical protein